MYETRNVRERYRIKEVKILPITLLPILEFSHCFILCTFHELSRRPYTITLLMYNQYK